MAAFIRILEIWVTGFKSFVGLVWEWSFGSHYRKSVRTMMLFWQHYLTFVRRQMLGHLVNMSKIAVSSSFSSMYPLGEVVLEANWMLVKYLFIKSELGRDREIFHSLVYSLVLGQAKARNFILVSHLSVRDPSTLAIFSCFSQAMSRELSQKWRNQDMNRRPYGMPSLLAAV